jgi:hypothetical protein
MPLSRNLPPSCSTAARTRATCCTKFAKSSFCLGFFSIAASGKLTLRSSHKRRHISTPSFFSPTAFAMSRASLASHETLQGESNTASHDLQLLIHRGDRDAAAVHRRPGKPPSQFANLSAKSSN